MPKIYATQASTLANGLTRSWPKKGKIIVDRLGKHPSEIWLN
ncbi:MULTISPECIES: helix-turn-helix domain-containing protein [Photorhabdus]|uniref:Ner winged helix-turn-helix DNA-binding domain-containing protein n=2 Tax=Photorhabdus khanii TaxID=1004150 RepID=A0A4V2X7G6_9GAMM|nr:helix-turn-helix domain-containing protein [Photorhabdus khanii]MQL50296.1 hypothetical protein [Photorhabdus khanii]TDB55855.1 hypothetical protein C5467_13125 [Photorhabdus khanii subsp. guanajuatensis]